MTQKAKKVPDFKSEDACRGTQCDEAPTDANRRRTLSMQMIRRLNRELGMPLEGLVGRD